MDGAVAMLRAVREHKLHAGREPTSLAIIPNYIIVLRSKKYEVTGPRRAPGKAPGPGGVLNLALVLDLERRGAGRRAGGEMGAGRDRIIELN